MRRLLLAVLALGLTGTLTDLLLLAHYEDVAQFIPLALILLALLVLGWHAARPAAGNLRVLRAVLILCVLAGMAGVGFHFNGAAEFQREIDPSLDWWAVVQKVARSQAPPLLAPGGLVQLGLFGLVYTFRHPLLEPGIPPLKEVTR